MINTLDTYKFSTKDGFNAVLLQLRYKELSKYFIGDSCLELGCADGEGTKLLLPWFKKIVAVDGSAKLLRRAKKEIFQEQVQFIHSYFEQLSLNEKFDTVLLTHILEHVDNPKEILLIAKKFVKKNGVIIVDVPNAKSLHRQIGVKLGMINSIYQLNDADISIGHKRVYDTNTFSEEIKKAGLTIKIQSGIFLKPFSNSQMADLLDEKSIRAFNELGKEHPEIAAEIFAVCTV